MAFNKRELVAEIKEQYLEEDEGRPWIVAFSGGKDSTTLLMLVWEAMLELTEVERKTRTVYIICNNTLVENPQVLTFVNKQLEVLREKAVEQGLPIIVDHTTPRLDDSFWVNLVGRGYPAPNNMFRWCTERLKISPTTHYIKEKISEHGEVIILLGTRSDESSNRAASIKRHEIKGQRLRKHPLPNAMAYAPIKDMTTDEVWTYLQSTNSPWTGRKNRDLITLYRNGSGGDCPLIMDVKTPSCGNSRFGCWVCTVVKRDRSMEALIDNGEDWMQPLVEIRDFLYGTIDRDAPDYDPDKYRMPIRRNKAEGLGPYWPKWRYHILKMILEAQKIAQEEDPQNQLITLQELAAIQVVWNRDHIYEYSVSDLYNEVYGKVIDFEQKGTSVSQEKKLLKDVCQDKPEDFNLINQLLNAQKNKVLLLRKHGLQNDLENILQEHVRPTFTKLEDY
ncbi:DNA phosphorothioation system sulfurtransferase DndC [Pontibacter anaerobius]|uniref:DNA phosphorothioation system sulfurtransferase DndC n=1 Tax=Pontibacter anaerobius TaxID=2993940 RepID=A0ABT3RJB1_9BACT|nr:DNA phosphorothioation system sulfurtransferase DndC [Pontibacter anaerobius]MCX2741459.1 DNA phosphorothioation system sulfurtransferase DndC [Pontibacter anaerobius]